MDMPKAHLNFLSGEQELSTLDGDSPLGASATFTGDAHDCGRFVGMLPGPNAAPNAGRNAPSLFRVGVAADQAGTLNIQHSPDGTTWFNDATTGATTVPADFTKVTVVEAKVIMRYVRVELVNGATAQTKVVLQTALVSMS